MTDSLAILTDLERRVSAIEDRRAREAAARAMAAADLDAGDAWVRGLGLPGGGQEGYEAMCKP